MSLYDIFYMGITSILSWMESFELYGVNLIHVVFLNLFLSLLWAFLFSPILGNRAGSGLSVSASDTVRGIRSADRVSKQVKDDRYVDDFAEAALKKGERDFHG